MTGTTPLKNAASEAADETVAFLLSKGASPDVLNNNKQTALVFAIHTLCSSTIALLAPVTTKHLGAALDNLAAFKPELTPIVQDLLIRRAALDKYNLGQGVGFATYYGAAAMLKILTKGWNKKTHCG